MRRLRAFWMRLCGVFARGRDGGEFEAELEGHIAEHVRDGVSTGLSEAEARREALLWLGGADR